MGVSSRQNDVLKVIHPGRHVEFYREPITAREIMNKYPRHCIARPDFFEFPWIVVRPESVLVPGKVFYLVPYRTIYKLLKAKMQQQSQSQEYYHSSKQNQSSKLHHHHDLNHYTKQKSPTKSLAGVTPKHQQQVKCNKRRSCNNVNNQEYHEFTVDQDSDTAKSLDKLAFYKSWNKMRSNLHQPQEGYNLLTSGLDSPFDDGTSFFSLTRSGMYRITSPKPEHDELLDVKSCLRKKDSIRKKFKLKVSFASPVVIPGGSRGESPWSVEEQDSL